MFLNKKYLNRNVKIIMHIKYVLSLVMIVHMFTFRDSL